MAAEDEDHFFLTTTSFVLGETTFLQLSVEDFSQ